MNNVARRLIVPAVIALSGLIIGFASSSTSAVGESRAAVWCYNGQVWILYAEGVPGSATQDDFTACLRRGVKRGDVVAFDGQVVAGGALIDLGDTRLFWTLQSGHSLGLSITAYDDRVVFSDNCDRVFEVRDGAARMTAPGYPCLYHERVRLEPDEISRIDFTIYVVQRQFVVDAAEGWYHIVRDWTGTDEDPTPRGQITLRGVNAAVWVTAEREAVDGERFQAHQPVANTAWDPQQYRAYDWEVSVRDEMIPSSFDRAAQYLLPDWAAYWDEVRTWLAAIMDDLFHGREPPVHLEVLDLADWQGYANPAERTISVSVASTNVILHELGHVLAGAEAGHGGDFVALMLMLWERYVPGFNTTRALELARQYAVEVGQSVAVEPVSQRTSVVTELFAKRAPVLPSDNTLVDPEDLLLQVVLEVGQTYAGLSNELVATSETMPTCTVEEHHSDGTTYMSYYPVFTEFSISAGGEWNGLSLEGFTAEEDGQITNSGTWVIGTPTIAGRVLVRVISYCPGGFAQEPSLLGYSEVIVRDPDSGG